MSFKISELVTHLKSVCHIRYFTAALKIVLLEKSLNRNRFCALATTEYNARFIGITNSKKNSETD